MAAYTAPASSRRCFISAISGYKGNTFCSKSLTNNEDISANDTPAINACLICPSTSGWRIIPLYASFVETPQAGLIITRRKPLKSIDIGESLSPIPSA
jgi:hypothetical protein